MALIKRIDARMLLIAAAVLFVVSLPLALALSNLRWFALEPSNYALWQQQHAVGDATGLKPDELAAVDRGLVRYLRSDRQSLQASLVAEGVVRSPFSERNAAHLLDVHDLVKLALSVQALAVGYGLLFLAVTVLGGARRLATKALAAGGIVTIALLGVLGVASLLDWNALFLRFHFISFSNDLWLLDPTRDSLIKLYPPGFFMDATIQLVKMSVIEALLLIALAGLVLRRGALGAGRIA